MTRSVFDRTLALVLLLQGVLLLVFSGNFTEGYYIVIFSVLAFIVGLKAGSTINFKNDTKDR